MIDSNTKIWLGEGCAPTVSLKPSFCVRSEVPVTVNKHIATNASELLEFATIWRNSHFNKCSDHSRSTDCKCTRWVSLLYGVADKLSYSNVYISFKYHKWSVKRFAAETKLLESGRPTSKSRRRKRRPPRDMRPSPSNAFKLSEAKTGHKFASAIFCKSVVQAL